MPAGETCTATGPLCCQSGAGIGPEGATCISNDDSCHANCSSNSECTSGCCAQVQGQTYGVCAEASDCSCNVATVANNCTIPSDRACTSTACCSPSSPYYCATTNLCYETAADAYAACPSLACVSCE